MATVLAASVVDIRTGRIPNALTLGAILVALPLRIAVEGAPGAASWACGLVGCLVPMVLLYVTLGTGGGDVKLVAAVGAIKGLTFGIHAMIALLVVGLVVAVARLGVKSALSIAATAWIGVLTFGLGSLMHDARSAPPEMPRALPSALRPAPAPAPPHSTPIAMAPLVAAAVLVALLDEQMGHPLGLLATWQGRVL